MTPPIEFPSMEEFLHNLDIARADPAHADMAYLAGVTEQCIIRYGSYQCEREDGHPLPHRAHIKTEWRG